MRAVFSTSNVKRAQKKLNVEMVVVFVDLIRFQSTNEMEASNAQVFEPISSLLIVHKLIIV